MPIRHSSNGIRSTSLPERPILFDGRTVIPMDVDLNWSIRFFFLIRDKHLFFRFQLFEIQRLILDYWTKVMNECPIYVDPQASLIFNCSLCHEVFQDPIVAQCGVGRFLTFLLCWSFFFLVVSAHILSSMHVKQRFVCCSIFSIRIDFIFDYFFFVVICPYDQQMLQIFVNNHFISQQIDQLLTWCRYGFKSIRLNNGEIKYQRDEHGCPVKISSNKKK